MPPKKKKTGGRDGEPVASTRSGLRSATVEEEAVEDGEQNNTHGEPLVPDGSTTTPSEGQRDAARNTPASPLTPIQENDEGDGVKGSSDHSRATIPTSDGRRDSAEPGGTTFIDEVAALVESANDRFEVVQNKILDYMEKQDTLAEQFDKLRHTAKREQDRLQTVINRLREKYGASAETQFSRGYADPDDVLERSKNYLFRERDDDETSSAYGQRQNAQRRMIVTRTSTKYSELLAVLQTQMMGARAVVRMETETERHATMADMTKDVMDGTVDNRQTGGVIVNHQGVHEKDRQEDRQEGHQEDHLEEGRVGDQTRARRSPSRHTIDEV
ncbi:hypothetical protein OH76DRAFT_1490793 [Lentinus brumalis]|uniref:Uncharacterized protein n=1 Tax=Lentinus brumalis TaxID=2498619 RepID=A0A371CHU5_9APHY|nr:hypothetical protein OH76DRAFT_1562302 [Polyporus brumalis]RDX39846.1 hypothetical protein OH76DRAFT_1490793 [Polyporus brumalis]